MKRSRKPTALAVRWIEHGHTIKNILSEGIHLLRSSSKTCIQALSDWTQESHALYPWEYVKWDICVCEHPLKIIRTNISNFEAIYIVTDTQKKKKIAMVKTNTVATVNSPWMKQTPIQKPQAQIYVVVHNLHSLFGQDISNLGVSWPFFISSIGLFYIQIYPLRWNLTKKAIEKVCKSMEIHCCNIFTIVMVLI